MPAAWTAPRTWVVGELVTKAMKDTYERDNQLYLKQRHLWVPVTWGSNGLSVIGSMIPIALLLLAAEYAVMSFTAPFDLVTVNNAYIIVIPNMTNANANWDIYSSFGAIGELYSTHTDNDVATTYNVTINQFYGVDVSGLLANLAAGDYGSVKLLQSDNAHDVNVVGFYMDYT